MVPTQPAKIVASSADLDTQLARIDCQMITAIMLVYGVGPDIDKVKANCEKCADADSDVAYCADPSVLSAAQRAKYALPGFVAVAIGGDKDVANPQLTTVTGQSVFEVNLAFSDAQSQCP